MGLYSIFYEVRINQDLKLFTELYAKLYTDTKLCELHPKIKNSFWLDKFIQNYLKYRNEKYDKILECILKNESSENYKKLRDKLLQTEKKVPERIKSLLKNIDLAEKLANSQLSSNDELEFYREAIKDLISNEIAKKDFTERLLVHIKYKIYQDPENSAKWLCNLTKILPQN